MSRRPAASLALALMALAACGPQLEAGPHAHEVQQQPLEPACHDDTTPIGELGLVVSTSLPRETRVKARITNRTAKTRIVAPQSVSLCVGPCTGYWAECDQRRSWQSEEDGPAYAVSLSPGQTLELEVDARLREQPSACEKVGLIAVLDVDGSRGCAELGRWIAVAD